MKKIDKETAEKAAKIVRTVRRYQCQVEEGKIVDYALAITIDTDLKSPIDDENILEKYQQVSNLLNDALQCRPNNYEIISTTPSSNSKNPSVKIKLIFDDPTSIHDLIKKNLEKLITPAPKVVKPPRKRVAIYI